MNPHFAELVDSLEPQFQELMAMGPVRWADMPPRIPRCGIYLFSEQGEHLYVGRTSNLRNRLRGHCAPSSSHYSAALATRLARETTGAITASYGRSDARRQLPDPVFEPAFAASRVRVSQMELRYVREDDPVRQAMLEIYVATALQTRYNDFRTR